MMANRYKKILVGIDGSEESDKAFFESIEIAQHNDAELVIAWINTDVERGIPKEGFSDKEELIYVRNVSIKETIAKNAGIKKVIPKILTGDPQKYLSKILPEEFDIDLIVLGATSTNIVKTILVGSTTKHVVKNAKCSVLVVK